MMAKVHVHIHTKDEDNWLDKDIKAVEAAIGVLKMASPHVRSQLNPKLTDMLSDLKNQKQSGVK